MLDKAAFIHVTPFLGVTTMKTALAFYRDVLGFTVYVDYGGYAYIERERVGFRLLALEVGAHNPPGCSHAYIDVTDVDACFAGYETRLRDFPEDRWTTPRDQPYGQREFWVRDPDGNLITFGQGIGENADQWDDRLKR